MTGGSIASSDKCLNKLMCLDERTWEFKGLADMKHARDAHGIISWRNRYIIVLGSWHVASSVKTCEVYDIQTNKWHELPEMNEDASDPGLIIMEDRYLYKLQKKGSNAFEILDLYQTSLFNTDNGSL